MRNDTITLRADFGNLWWPNYDHKPEAAFGLVSRHLRDMDATIKLCQRRRCVVQAGAHVGLWPQRLAASFMEVYAFEPEPPLYECARRNIRASTVRLSPCALGAEPGVAFLQRRSSAGSSRIDDTHGETVEVVTIDSLGLTSCDAIFLDVEGYEIEALKGAADTIEASNPVLHLEHLDRTGPGIAKYVASLGYREHHRVGRDHVYTRAAR